MLDANGGTGKERGPAWLVRALWSFLFAVPAAWAPTMPKQLLPSHPVGLLLVTGQPPLTVVAGLFSGCTLSVGTEDLFELVVLHMSAMH